MHLGRGISSFIVPRHYELYGKETKIDSLGNRLISPNNCLWLTNLDYKKRHEILPLTKKYDKNKYELYDNFDGINVNRTIDIPLDYRGSMGVPITFYTNLTLSSLRLLVLGREMTARICP